MAKAAGRARTDNPRLKIGVAISLVNQLHLELRFLGVDYRVVEMEERRIESQADFIRAIVVRYINRALDQGVLEPIELDEDSQLVSVYLDRSSKGLWETAIRKGVAISYPQLVNSALVDYFQRQDTIADSLKRKIPALKQCLQRIDLSELKKLLGI